MNEFILLEDRKSGPLEKNSLFFSDSTEEILCTDPAQLTFCLDHIDELRQQGYYLVGVISYEASYFLEPRIVTDDFYKNEIPLLHFLAFKNSQTLTQNEVHHLLEKLTAACPEESFAYHTQLNLSEKEYQEAFNQIKNHLYQGNTYQVNYTGKYTFGYHGSPLKLYQSLRERQKVEYAALLFFKDYQILSLSPELFYSKRVDIVTMKPMKGTMPRATNSEEDKKNKAFLTTDTKLIAENMMIVDLLRNDLSSLSQPGSVRACNLLHVDTYETVHQMISTIQSRVDPTTPFKTFIKKLFPCGSVTGVPKKRTMQIIRELEKEPRGIYTGTIGYITPTNDMCFNVSIRTLCIKNNKGELGIGGGIVNDSSAASEFEEMKLKARFFTEMNGVR